MLSSGGSAPKQADAILVWGSFCSCVFVLYVCVNDVYMCVYACMSAYKGEGQGDIIVLISHDLNNFKTLYKSLKKTRQGCGGPASLEGSS